MPQTTEAFSRVKIDAQLRDVGWTLDDGISVHFEYTLSDGTKADYVLCDRDGRPLAVIEAKRQSTMPTPGAEPGAGATPRSSTSPTSSSPTATKSGSGNGSGKPIPHRQDAFSRRQDLERRAATLILRKDPARRPHRQARSPAATTRSNASTRSAGR